MGSRFSRFGSYSMDETKETTGDPELLHCFPREYCILQRDDSKKISTFRILQWNVLAQALATQVDNFIKCPQEALQWKYRMDLIVKDILSYNPDIVCLQEVDYFDFFETSFGSHGYIGHFQPKPYSPCLNFPKNNGPDGCAIFYRKDKFKMKILENKILIVDGNTTNSVTILLILEDIVSKNELCILTTHLKAKKSPELVEFRAKQTEDLMQFLESKRENKATIICGDFNGEPSEPLYSKVLNSSSGFVSSYQKIYDGEPPFTTWKIRKDGEQKHTIDYIFRSSKLSLIGGYKMPEEKYIGSNRLPSFAYPSDHLSLICDFSFCNE